MLTNLASPRMKPRELIATAKAPGGVELGLHLVDLGGLGLRGAGQEGTAQGQQGQAPVVDSSHSGAPHHTPRRTNALRSTNPLERLNAEIKRRTNVVGIFPNDAAVTRLVGAMLLEQNDEWSLNRRYMQLEGLQALTDTAPTRLPAVQR